MKTIIKSLCLLVFALAIFNCDNDDGDPITSPNEDVCNYQGLTFLDTNDNTQTLLPEAQLQTDLFPNNGGPGIAMLEIYETTNPGNIFFLTDVLTLNATGAGTITVNGTVYNVNVKCQRAGTAVGDEFRFDLTGGGIEAELCVIIDEVNP